MSRPRFKSSSIDHFLKELSNPIIDTYNTINNVKIEHNAKVLPNWSQHSINIVDMCGHDHKKGKKTLTQLILSSPRSKVRSQIYVWCQMSI
jgi:hypothetical protein